MQWVFIVQQVLIMPMQWVFTVQRVLIMPMQLAVMLTQVLRTLLRLVHYPLLIEKPVWQAMIQ